MHTPSPAGNRRRAFEPTTAIPLTLGIGMALAGALGIVLPMSAAAQNLNPAGANRFIGSSVSAGGSDNAGGQGYRYQSVQAYVDQDVKGKSQSVWVQAYEYYSISSGWGYRSVGCTLPESVMETSKNGATINAVLDASSAQCQNFFGYRYDNITGYQPWPFTSEAVSVTLGPPRYTSDSNSRYTYRDNVTGQSEKSNCKIDSGGGAQGSIQIGVSAPMLLAGNNGSGYFYDRRCVSLSK